MEATSLTQLTSHLDQLLRHSSYNDSSLNGLQVESTRETISKIAFAVDSGELVLEQAVRQQAHLLVVHHGLLWGALERVSGPLARKLGILLNNGCSLYASHLPLDGHSTLGNGAELARLLELVDVNPAFTYKGSPIGVVANCPSPISIETLAERGRKLHGAIVPTIIRAGPEQIQKIGIVTGSGTFAIQEAKSMGLELLISGEPKQEAFHLAHEYKINALFLGHYASETLGVLALKRYIEREFNLDTIFIDIPTGI